MSRSDVNNRLEPHLPRLRATFDRLITIEGDADVDWVALLKLREWTDPLCDDAYYRGYFMGILDAVGVSVAEAMPMLRSRSKPSRRITNDRRNS